MRWKKQTRKKKMNKIKIALAPFKFENNNISYNMAQIDEALKRASGKSDIVCFGEAFLQGFDSLSWNYDKDKSIALSKDSQIVLKICEKTKKYNVDLGLGYIELYNDSIYSSYMIISKGSIIHNYRRISIGWKEVDKCDFHYKEGTSVDEFTYKEKTFKIALCGDAWTEEDKFKTEGILLWPVYVNFSLNEWENEKNEYLDQASKLSSNVILINSIDDFSNSHGGAFYYKNKKIHKYMDFDKEELLFIEI